MQGLLLQEIGHGASHGEYIALDCDDIYAENKIAEQVSILESTRMRILYIMTV